MPNIRVLYNNLADTATITSSGAVNVNMDTPNLKTEIKTEVFRSPSTSVTFTIDWDVNVKSINCIILPCTNLSATATIRVRLYNFALAQLYDTSTITAVPGWNLELGNSIHNVNLFSYGVLSKTAIWLPSTVPSVRRIVIDLVDTSNTAGYIDCSRILTGVYWEPSHNIENGIQLNITDESATTRTNAGNLVVDRGFVYDRISFNYSLLTEQNKSDLGKIIRVVGTNKNFFISLFPDNSSDTEEHDFMIYGKRVNAPFTYKLFGFYNHSMEMISW